jgi:hypothetical protein
MNIHEVRCDYKGRKEKPRMLISFQEMCQGTKKPEEKLQRDTQTQKGCTHAYTLTHIHFYIGKKHRSLQFPG